MKTLEQRIETSILRNPNAPDFVIAKNLRTVVAEVAKVRESLGHSPQPPPAHSPASGLALRGGVVLAGKPVSMKRPADSIADNFRRLPKGQGFPLSEASLAWGASEETVKRHAKAKNCLRYVDLGHGDWQPMVMHPDTAANLT